MAVFRYELRQTRGYIIAWAVSLAVIIFIMLPVYMGFLVGSDVLSANLTNSSFYETFGASMNHIGTPIGVYGFLTAFAMIAAAIGGMHMGMKVFTKEYMQKTADFLMTKPYTRARLYRAKLASAMCGCVIIGLSYGVGSFAAAAVYIGEGLDYRAFTLIALSFILIQLLFLSLGALVGTIMPRIRTPLLASSAATFFMYILGSFSRKTGIDILKFFTPFVYFENARIIETGGYNMQYMAAYIIFVAAFLFISYRTYLKKDVILVS